MWAYTACYDPIRATSRSTRPEEEHVVELSLLHTVHDTSLMQKDSQVTLIFCSSVLELENKEMEVWTCNKVTVPTV